jgi:signal transduction histidine kinase
VGRTGPGSGLIDPFRRFADTRSAPLPWRLSFGASTAAIGLIVVLALDDLLDDALVLAAFFPAVQIAALLGGLAAAACSALISALIVHIWITPFPDLWPGFLLFFVSAALAGAAVRAARQARAARRERAEAGSAPVVGGRSFETVAATIAHDLNQPLAAAVAYLQSARRLLAAAPVEVRAPPSVVESLDKAAAQLSRAGRLIAGLREFLAHGPSRLTPVELHGLIEEAAGACAFAPSLRLAARDDVALADRMQIEQLLAAMLAHAPLASRAGGSRVATFSDETLVTVEITLPARRDAPAGDSEAWASELSIWRAIVEAHGGALRIAATAEGAMIAFSLPLATPAPAIGG